MTSVVLPLPETEQSIIRPVVMSIVQDIIVNTQMPLDIQVIYPAHMDVMPQPGSLLQSNSREATYEPKTRLTVEVEEKYGSSYIGSNVITRTDMKPVFHDTKLDVFIKPIYTKSKMTLNLKYSHISRNAILQWRDNLRMRLSQTFDSFLNNIDYHYLLPYKYLDLLRLIYQYRQNIGGYSDNYNTWIGENSSNRITQVSTLVGSDPRIGIREKQIRLLALIEFDTLLGEPEKDHDGTLWTISFVYKFNYMKPIGCNMSYPLMIHNQLLPEEYIIPSLDTQVDRILPETADQLIGSLRDFEIYRLSDRYSGKTKPLQLPYFDDFYPMTAPTYTTGIFHALCQITPTNLTSLLNLNHLDYIVLDPCILSYFSTEYPYLTQIYKSFYHLELYEDDILMGDQSLTVDANLDVSSTSPLDIRKRYHVRLSMIIDFKPIYRAAFDRFRKYPCAVVNTVTAISNALDRFPEIQGLRGLKQISIYDMYLLYRHLTGSNDFLTANEITNLDRIKPYGYLTSSAFNTLRKDSVNMNTVMTTYIATLANRPVIT
jgi:hypothetical protein